MADAIYPVHADADSVRIPATGDVNGPTVAVRYRIVSLAGADVDLVRWSVVLAPALEVLFQVRARDIRVIGSPIDVNRPALKLATGMNRISIRIPRLPPSTTSSHRASASSTC